MFPWTHTEYPNEDTLNKALAKTKGQLFLQGTGAGFLGSLVCDHEFVWDEFCDTAWCNGKQIGFNPRFFWWMTPDSRVTVLAHELWHTGYDHMNRMDGRDPLDWNIAADHVINLRLEEWGYDFSQLTQLQIIKDPAYKDMTTEQIYDLIHDPKSPPPPSAGSPGQGGGSSGSNQPYPPRPNDPPQNGLSGDVRQPSSKADKAEIAGKIVKAIQAAKAAGEPGSIPGEITQVMEEFLNPVLPWEILLERFYTELSLDDYTWRRPSRRHETEYLPSLGGDNGLDHLMYFIDISGSVTDRQALRFFSEVKHIHEVHQPKRITMITFDTVLHDFYELTADDPFEKFEITGRGGTCFRCVHKHIEEHKPTAAIIFTDLGAAPMAQTSVPVLWVVSNGRGRKAPFGKQIDIKEPSCATSVFIPTFRAMKSSPS